VGVIVAAVNWPTVSATTYFTGDATPVNVASGTKVTVPAAFTVYVPWPVTVNVVNVHFVKSASVEDGHNLTDDASSAAGDVAESFANTAIT
jgi:hypothetical protein